MAQVSEASPAADGLALEALRLELAPHIAAAAVFDGWSADAVASAARQVGVDPAAAAFAFGLPSSRDAAMEMIAAWIGHVDAAMARALPAEALAGLPVRERIRRLVQFRLDCVAGQEEALRRALAIMAMPRHAARALHLGWHSADAMWRLAGDSATDFNHYSKRAILAGIYGATLAVFADDKSDDKAGTRAFLDRRIAGIIRFEKAKAQWRPPEAVRFSMSRLLGRLRYPAA